MDRITFALRAHPGMRDKVEAALRARAAEMQTAAAREGIGNFSIWGIEDLFFGYGERAAGHPAGDGCAALRDVLMAALNGDGEMLCDLGAMRLMYHVEGTVCEDKSLIRHRVFSTRLKPGCEEEYKRRHDALGATQSAESPESNFTIWCGAGYIWLLRDHQGARACHDDGRTRFHHRLGDAAVGDHGLADGRRRLDHGGKARSDPADRIDKGSPRPAICSENDIMRAKELACCEGGRPFRMLAPQPLQFSGAVWRRAPCGGTPHRQTIP